MVSDLKDMTRKELEQLGRDVQKAIDKLQKQDVKKLRQEMEKLAASHGLTVQDVMSGNVTPTTKPKVQSPPKYANPADPTQTWSGKGRQPEWFKSAIGSGTDPDSMAI